MAGLARESSFLPTIKCSTCGCDVEISLMGEHVCGALLVPSERKLYTPRSFPYIKLTPVLALPSIKDVDERSIPYGKPTQNEKRLPPKVDTSAASKFGF